MANYAIPLANLTPFVQSNVLEPERTKSARRFLCEELACCERRAIAAKHGG